MSVTRFTPSGPAIAWPGGSGTGAVPMARAELGKAVHGHTILLVRPGELEPEVALRQCGRGVTARDEDAQRSVAVDAELTNTRLQGAELFPSAARQESECRRRSEVGAHTRRNASNSAVVSSSSAITSQ